MKFITNIDNVLAKIWLEFTSNLFLAGLKWSIFLSVILINLFDMMPVQIFFFLIHLNAAFPCLECCAPIQPA